MEDKRYIKLFNQGYFLAKNEPLVFKALVDAAKGQADILAPLSAGHSEFQKEQFLEKTRTRVNNSRRIEKDKGHKH